MSKLATCFFLAAGLLLGTGTDGLSQQFTGGIRGTVRDANGVIPGAAVTVTNEATSVPRDTVTNAVGEYNFPALAPATYTLRASLPGYKASSAAASASRRSSSSRSICRSRSARSKRSITVTADAPLIETSNASQGGVLDRQILEELPSHGRNAFMIGVTVPTVLSVGEPRFNRQQDQMVSSQLSLGGGGVQANNYTLDGVPITDMRGFPVLNPTIEAIDDIKVQVHTFDAEMGRTGGGVFNTTARSGANAFHGTAFYQTRPVWGPALEYFREKRGATKESSGLSESFYHLYGGGIGGPIVKNRTFFWSATEGYRDQVIQGLSRTWPSARQRIGDFSTTTLNGAPVRIFNPYCRDGVANANCPATGTGSLATGGEFTNAIIPADAPRRQPGGVQDGQLLAAAAQQQREQPVERQHDGQPARLRRHVDLQGRAQIHRQLVAERPVHLQPDQGAGRLAGARRAVVPGAGRQLADPAPQGLRAEQHQRAQRHDWWRASATATPCFPMAGTAGADRRAWAASATASRRSGSTRRI